MELLRLNAELRCYKLFSNLNFFKDFFSFTFNHLFNLLFCTIILVLLFNSVFYEAKHSNYMLNY